MLTAFSAVAVNAHFQTVNIKPLMNSITEQVFLLLRKCQSPSGNEFLSGEVIRISVSSHFYKSKL